MCKSILNIEEKNKMSFIAAVNEKWKNKRIQMIFDLDESVREELMSIEIINVDETVHEDEYNDEGFWSQYELTFKKPDGNTYILGQSTGWRSIDFEIIHQDEDKYYEGKDMQNFFGVVGEQAAKIEKLFEELNIPELAKNNIQSRLKEGEASRKKNIGQEIVDVYEKDRLFYYVLKNGQTITERSDLFRDE